MGSEQEISSKFDITKIQLIKGLFNRDYLLSELLIILGLTSRIHKFFASEEVSPVLPKGIFINLASNCSINWAFSTFFNIKNL